MIILFRLIFNALGLLLIAELISGIKVDGLYAALIAAVVLGLLNLIVKPILLILTLPITILTLGLFAFVINGALFFFAASFIDGFDVDNYWYALFGSILMSVVSAISNRWIKSRPAPAPEPRVQYREIRDEES